MKKNQGFTLIEVLITVAIFAIFTLGIYFTYANVIEVIGKSRNRTLGSEVLNREIEIIRNLPYEGVGIIGGFPAGDLTQSKQVNFEGNIFEVETFVRNVDDPFDGTVDGDPVDLAPADYKLVEFYVDCLTCGGFVPLTFTTWIAPRHLETSTENGSLFINVFDASGVPVSGADVVIENSAVDPSFTIIDTTNASGTLRLVDVPPSNNSYEISVSKSGYTSSRTYEIGSDENPNPLKPHATVATQEITSISFSIDRVSALNISTRNMFCQGVPEIDFNHTGQRLIGSGPDVLEYAVSYSTDSLGKITVNDIPWDSHTLVDTDPYYGVGGSSYLMPVTLAPNETKTLDFFVDLIGSSSLLVTATNEQGVALTGVDVSLEKLGFNESRVTGEYNYLYSDWSFGGYLSQDGNIEENLVPGQLTLKQIGGEYPTSTNSWLTSNTIDFGTSTANLLTLSWSGNTPGGTQISFQVASNNGGAFNYIGPDGTNSSYYTTSGANLSNFHSGNQFVRYKVYLNTTVSTATPTLYDLDIKFNSGCIPKSQVFWADIPSASYDISASKSGYQTATTTVFVGAGWQEIKVPLIINE
ncbi:MAG: hypothetical protein COU06_00915 [Candidatus Harrisonbacteria bacterium CG10_big_fil_rev_8_21_14_0_10_38_8]|uniref:PEGA domain-containing protein n=1 Tax=Candidatus Harrisonbacteria bacterium CG10_big_fil_rev_8_21_14_0_10_38_8 TaxID=1974582 RepID=A0A2M6WKH2_9BACT|nr:MAG: hypothetical protein COU06_00915 [Candidatus Harrisonbacteria bacterium CG10_big_fil_rev_8_21_14_0_10_38_8]